MRFGHSGDTATVTGGVFAKVSGRFRLLEQAALQAAFSSASLRSPRVLGYGWTPDRGFWLETELVPSSSPVHTRRGFSKLLQHLDDALEAAPGFSPLREVFPTGMYDRLLTGSGEPLSRLRWRLAEYSLTAVPVGHPHGDFTLCNTLECPEGEVWVFDFLPGPGTPLFDIAKLLQDVRFGWINKLGGGLAPEFLEDCRLELEARYASRPWWRAVLVLLGVALLRLYPYCDAEKRSWVEEKAVELCGTW